MKHLHHTAINISVFVLTATILAGCDSSSVDDGPTGSLSGIVREDGTQNPLSSVSVQFGSAQATTNQDGRYTLSDVPVGQSMALRASATGFDNFSEQILVQAGNNTRDISMARKRFYTYQSDTGNFGVYLPTGVSSYRGVVFLIAPPQEEVDTRGFANGTASDSNPDNNAYMASLRQSALGLAQKYGLALMGGKIIDESRFSSTSFDNVLKALEQAATESGRAELASASLLLIGHSRGGCYAYSFTIARSERVIGFMSFKGGCHTVGDGGAAKNVPGYFFIGATDEESRAQNITEVFDTNRPNGALWALATEPGAGHNPVADFGLIADWMDAVMAGRLPEAGSAGSPLRFIDEATGWLGNREARSIAGYASYEGDKQHASWLPSSKAAEDWQTFVTRTPSL